MSAWYDNSVGDLPLFAKPPPAVMGSDTSRAAAAAIRPVAGTLRAQVLACIEASDGITDEEGCERTGIGASTWRPRRVELWEAGLIREAGKRQAKSGRLMAVWYAAGGGGGDHATGP